MTLFTLPNPWRLLALFVRRYFECIVNTGQCQYFPPRQKHFWFWFGCKLAATARNPWSQTDGSQAFSPFFCVFFLLRVVSVRIWSVLMVSHASGVKEKNLGEGDMNGNACANAWGCVPRNGCKLSRSFLPVTLILPVGSGRFAERA